MRNRTVRNMIEELCIDYVLKVLQKKEEDTFRLIVIAPSGACIIPAGGGGIGAGGGNL